MRLSFSRTTGHRAGPAVLAVAALLMPPLAPAGESPAAADAPPRALLVPDEEAKFASPLGGRVLRVLVRPGERFRKGDLLIEFDCARQQFELTRTRARLEAADATLRSNLRLLELQSIGELELALSRSQRAEVEAGMHAAELELRYCRLEAPWDGAVVARHVNPLESVAAGQPLLEINSVATPRMQLIVPSGWLAWLRAGARFEVEILETGRRYPALVKRLGTEVDAVSQTVELFAEFDGEAEGLLPGMTGTALLAPPAP